jgi:chromosome segregation ATPase
VERQLQALQQQLQHSSRSREELQKSKDSIQAQLVEARGECRKLRDEVEKSKNANTSLDRELAQLKSRISTSTQVQVDELHDMRRQNEQLKDDVRAGKDALRDNQAVHEKDIRKYKSIADKFKNDIKKYLEEVERKERELQQGRRLASKLQTEVERLEREKRTAQENLQICRLSLKEKDKNREEHRPREPDVGDDQRLPKGGEGTSSSSVSTGSNRPKRMQAVADAQQQQQLHAEKSILEAERAQLLLQVEETQESLRSVELDRASLCERVLTLQDARDKAQAQNQRLECILGERGQQVQELEEAKVRAEDEVIQMRQNIEVLSHHLQEAKATASSREADALAAKEDALAAQRDATAWKDMYEASQGSASRIKDMHRRSGERIDALAAEKEAVHKECELLRQRLSRATDELAKVARGKVEAEEMLARAEESIRDEQERSAQLVARHKQALLDVSLACLSACVHASVCMCASCWC